MNTSIGQSRRQAGGADAVGKPHAAEDFHGAGVAPLHLGQELRCLLLLDQRAAHAAHAEIDGERQPHRTGADDQNPCGTMGIPWHGNALSTACKDAQARGLPTRLAGAIGRATAHSALPEIDAQWWRCRKFGRRPVQRASEAKAMKIAIPDDYQDMVHRLACFRSSPGTTSRATASRRATSTNSSSGCATPMSWSRSASGSIFPARCWSACRELKLHRAGRAQRRHHRFCRLHANSAFRSRPARAIRRTRRPN